MPEVYRDQSGAAYFSFLGQISVKYPDGRAAKLRGGIKVWLKHIASELDRNGFRIFQAGPVSSLYWQMVLDLGRSPVNGVAHRAEMHVHPTAVCERLIAEANADNF